MFYHIDNQYYFDNQHQNVSKLFTIKDMPNRIFTIHKFHNEMWLSEKYYLIFQTHTGFKKVLFLPNEENVISNYNELEDELIDNFINEKEAEEPANDYLVWLFLSISLGINGWLLFRFYRK